MNTKPVLPFMLSDCAMDFHLTSRSLKGNDMRNLKTNYSDHWHSIIDTRCRDCPMDYGQNARTLDHVHALKTPLKLMCLQDESHCSPSIRPTFLYITLVPANYDHFSLLTRSRRMTLATILGKLFLDRLHDSVSRRRLQTCTLKGLSLNVSSCNTTHPPALFLLEVIIRCFVL